MPDATVTYKKPETLKILKSLAKYLDFKISAEKKKKFSINGVTIIPSDKNADPDDLSELVTERNIDAAMLRKDAWKRNS